MTVPATNPEPIGVVFLLNNEATCTVHGFVGKDDEFTDAEAYADEHVDQHDDCWADHCGGKGCTNLTCSCNHERDDSRPASMMRRVDFDIEPDDRPLCTSIHDPNCPVHFPAAASSSTADTGGEVDAVPTDPEALGALMAERTDGSRELWRALEKQVGNWDKAMTIWHLACPVADRIRRARTPAVRRLEAALAARERELAHVVEAANAAEADAHRRGVKTPQWVEALRAHCPTIEEGRPDA